MVHIEDVEEGWVFFKYERLLSFAIIVLSFAIVVVYSLVKIMNIKKLDKVVSRRMMMIFNLVHGFVLWLQNLVRRRVILANPIQERKTMMKYMYPKMNLSNLPSTDNSFIGWKIQ